jgi:hypothetical protein
LRSRALATYERLGARWWRDRLTSWNPQGLGEPVHRPGRLHLHPIPGGLWLVGADPAAVPLRALRGFGYLRELLRRPHQPVDVLDLVGAGAAIAMEGGTGEILDQQALKAYRRRLRDLDQEIAEAEDWSDLGRLDAIRAERDALLHEIASATGLGGRVRTTGSSRERARIAARKAISAAIDRVATVDEAVARNLRADIHTGTTCSYEPDTANAPGWILD